MLKERIDILQQGQVISAEVAEYSKKVIDLLEDGNYDEAKMEMFTTHLAMATERVKKNEPVETLDDSIWEQISADRCYSKAADVFAKIVSLCPVVYPDGERKFLMMHLCSLLQDKED